MGKLMWWGMSSLSKPPFLVQLQGEVSGEKEGKPVNAIVSISHADGYELTSIPVVACIMQYLDARKKKPGVWLMGEYSEPSRLFSDMETMGVRVTGEVRQRTIS